MEKIELPAIRRIPPEIWRKIFVMIWDLSSQRSKLSEMFLVENNMLALSRVCKHWRALVFDTSSLWRDVSYRGPLYVGPASSLNHVRASLARSGQQTITVRIHFTHFALDKNYRPQPSEISLADVMQVVMGHIHRIEVLGFVCRPDLQPKERVFRTDPMTLLGRTFPWSGIPCINLKRLSMWSVAFPSLSCLRLFLRDCRQLEDIQAVEVELAVDTLPEAEGYAGPLHLPALTVAQWDIRLFLTLQKLGLRMPQLLDLRLRTASAGGPWTGLGVLDIQALSKTIKTLTLDGPFPDEISFQILTHWDTTTFIPRFPQLHTLRLYNCQGEKDLMYAFTIKLGGAKLFPCLADLALSSTLTTDEDILDVLEAYTVMEDNKSKALIQINVEGCPKTTQKIADILEERYAGSWRKDCKSMSEYL